MRRTSLEEGEKRDPLDTFVRKMEELRPECPISSIEDLWVKFTDWFIEVTPEIPILPPPAAFDPWSYDTDGDCYISMGEANTAVQDWHHGPLTEAQAMEVVGLWQGGTRNPACGEGEV